MSQPQLSIEEHMRVLTNPDMTIRDLLVTDINLLNFGQTSSVNPTCVPYNEVDLIGERNREVLSYLIDFDGLNPQNCGIGKNDLDDYLPKADRSTADAFDTSSFLAIDTNMEYFQHFSAPVPQAVNPLKSLPLSSSVDVPQQRRDSKISRPIEIAYDLEEIYKARYKTDYFSQEGTIRSPRYVTDRRGNHWVTLIIQPGLEGYIRIDWITVPTADNKRYSMPYKMQPDSKQPNLPDQNPVLLKIEVDKAGFMKIYLVLIKCKQDKLRESQPLQLFSSSSQSMGNIQFPETGTLSPKQLIERFQLDKSQLAFTFCPLAPNGKSCKPDWSTTVLSTVMTEKSTDSPSKRKITCPNCTHSFDVTIDESDDVQPRKVVKKR